ncbi:hypothetical protein SSS_02492 [Sarcoptes scabiei]|nr:hypothetical protein SSS_02492 [Sarcoptes scabiei]
MNDSMRFRFEKHTIIIFTLANLCILFWVVFNLIIEKDDPKTSTIQTSYGILMRASSETIFKQHNDIDRFRHDYYDSDDEDDGDGDGEEDLYDDENEYSVDGNLHQNIDDQFSIEMFSSLTEILVDLIGLIAILKENYYLCIFFAVFGGLNVCGSILYYCQTLSTNSFIQMCLVVVFYAILIIFVYDLYRKKRRQKQQQQQHEKRAAKNETDLIDSIRYDFIQENKTTNL